VKPYLEKPFTKIGLVEWLKVKALSSSPSTTKKKFFFLFYYSKWGPSGAGSLSWEYLLKKEFLP
jgi:hypothetical protein